MMAGRDAGRERRLRSAWRHEQPNVAMALAAASNHSAQQDGAPRSLRTATRAREGEVHEKHDGLRAQKRPLPGTRLEPPEEVSEPQLGAVTVGYVTAPEPLLVVPSMAGGDSVDGIALKVLLKVALSKKQKEEEAEERKKQEKQRKKEQEEERRQAVQAVADLFSSAPLSSSSRRKKKTSSHCFSLGVWVLLVEYTDSSPYSPRCLVSQWLHFHASVSEAFLDEFHRKPGLSSSTGIWHPLVRCLSRQRSTGKFGVLWVTTTRNYFYGPLYLAVTGAVLLLACRAQESGFFRELTSDLFPHSALMLGSTVATILCQSTVVSDFHTFSS